MASAQVFLYADLCELTYNNYVHNKAEQAAVEKQLAADGKAEERAASVLGGVWVGGFRYGPSELMALPAGNKQKVPQSADEGQLPADIPPNEVRQLALQHPAPICPRLQSLLVLGARSDWVGKEASWTKRACHTHSCACRYTQVTQPVSLQGAHASVPGGKDCTCISWPQHPRSMQCLSRQSGLVANAAS
jgi:hypothetical protein